VVPNFRQRAPLRHLIHAKRSHVARAGVTIGGVCLLLYWVAHERALNFAATWPALLLGLFLSQLSFACYAARFRAVMRITDIDLLPLQALKLSARALFYHYLLPLSVGNDLTRLTLCRAAAPAVPVRLIAGGIVLDHGIGTLALLLLVCTVGWHLIPGVEFSWQKGWGFGLVGVLVISALGYWAHPLWQRLAGWRARLCGHWSCVVQALALSLLMQSVLAAALHSGAQGWHIDLPYVQILAVLAASGLLQILPFNFGGLHLGDVAGTGMYVALGLSLSDAILLGSLLVCYRLMMAVIGGLWDLGMPRVQSTKICL
jgi:Lysylphosphatidylglycerol synthase TM region